MKRIAVTLLLAMLATGTVAHAASDGTGFDAQRSCAYPSGVGLPGSGAVRNVPSAYPTIQAAVDAAAPGDTVLVAPGTYKESVLVTKDRLRIRGTDRNAVILNGGTATGPGKQYGIFVRGADYVVIENMTGRNYGHTAFFWHHAHGYMGSYLTAYNNDQYGVYALDSRCGQFDHVYGSGNADSAIYIGECFPCDAVITDSVAEENGLGYSGTNAGGNLTLRDSIWRNNGLGIVPNSLAGEDNPPQRGATIKNNLVIDNNNKTAPGSGLTGQFWGGGIVIAGGVGNVVAGNTVIDHAMGGIVLAPLPDGNLWIPTANTIWHNKVSHDPVEFPDAVDLAQNTVSGVGNCWSFNEVGNTAPAVLQEVWSCAHPTTPPGGDPRVELSLLQGAAGVNGRAPQPAATWPAPGPQASQPDDDGDADYANDGGVDAWIPAVL